MRVHGPFKGVTAVEILAIIAIIGLLVGILLPAVQSAREASRRLSCQSHLKQIGFALHAHQTATGVYPPPMPMRTSGEGKLWTSPKSISGLYLLLPHIEQIAIYNSVNLTPLGTSGLLPASIQNITACTTRLEAYLCPSDQVAMTAPGPTNSYRFNVGNAQPTGIHIFGTSYQYPSRATLAGAFVPQGTSRDEEFLDGFATTVAFAERWVGTAQSTKIFQSGRDIWGAGIANMFSYQSEDGVLEVCRVPIHNPRNFKNNLGSSWALAGCKDVWYNHVAPPNDRGSDCVLGEAVGHEMEICDFCSVASRSSHPSGVNCLMMDGSVHLVRDTISLALWRALGTRSGGEVDNSF